MEIDNVLRSLYYDPKHPSSFSTAEKLYKDAKEILPKISLSDVKDWLSGEFTYTLHKPIRKYYKRNPIIVEEIDQQWEADLVDMQEYKKTNKGYTFMLTVIDIMSKYAWAIPIKDKRGASVVKAFEIIFKNRTPKYIRTDQGKEFLNKEFKKLLEKYNVYHFTSINKTIKCAIVERFNRTIKGKMFKYFTSKGTRKWYNIVDDLVSAYNSSIHRSIKMSPIQALSTDNTILFQNMYGVKDVTKLYKNKPISELNEGDVVRKKYNLGPFDKSYFPNWSDQTFKVKTKTDEPVKPVFKIEDEKGDQPKERYYPEEVQKIKETMYRIEKIIKKRIYKKKKQLFIKWLNYPDSYNSWINEDQVHKL